MSFLEFQQSLTRDNSSPAEASLALQALWHDARGDWERAHAVAQEDPGRDGSWVHGYLHRKEGDTANAAYWYTQARRPVVAVKVTPEEEWADIARELLGG